MFKSGGKQVAEAVRVHGSSHVRCGVVQEQASAFEQLVACGDVLNALHEGAADVASDGAHDGVVVELGEGEVEASAGLGTGVHRCAKAGAAGLCAVGSDDEDAVTTGGVIGVAVGVVEEHAVLDGDGGEVAGADAEEGEFSRGGWLFDLGKALRRASGSKERGDGDEKFASKGMRADVVAKEGVIFAWCEAVMAWCELVGDADGEVFEAVKVVVHDGAVSNGGAEDREAV
jgi:hypothetical protein